MSFSSSTDVKLGIRSASNEQNPTVLAAGSSGGDARFFTMNQLDGNVVQILFHYNQDGLLVVSGSGCLLTTSPQPPHQLVYQPDPQQCLMNQNVVGGFTYIGGMVSTIQQMSLGRVLPGELAALFPEATADRFYVEPTGETIIQHFGVTKFDMFIS